MLFSIFCIFVYCFFFFGMMMILVYFAMLIKAGCDTQSNAKYHTTALFDDIEIAFFFCCYSLARSLSLLSRFFCTQYFFNVTLRLLIFNHTIHIHTQYKHLHKRTRTFTYSVNHTMLMFLSLHLFLYLSLALNSQNTHLS